MPDDDFQTGQGRRHRVFVDEDDRLSDSTGYTKSDLDTLGIQRDTKQVFFLSQINPTLWSPVNGGGRTAIAVTHTEDDLTDAGTTETVPLELTDIPEGAVLQNVHIILNVAADGPGLTSLIVNFAPTGADGGEWGDGSSIVRGPTNLSSFGNGARGSMLPEPGGATLVDGGEARYASVGANLDEITEFSATYIFIYYDVDDVPTRAPTPP